MARLPWSLTVALALVLLAVGSAAQARRGKPHPGGRPQPSARARLATGHAARTDQGASQGAKKQAGKASRPPGPRPTKPTGKPTTKPEAEREPLPLRPMEEADLVTAEADHRFASEEARELFLQDHFRVCDLDGNGWISLREAGITLSMDRDEYRRAATDQDGRIDSSEFLAQRDVLLARLGALPVEPPAEPKPRARTQAEQPTPPLGADDLSQLARSDRPAFHSELGSMRVKPGDILKRYDADHSKGIDATEIARLFSDVQLSLSPELVIAQMDPNGSGELEPAELVPIAWMVSQRVPPRAAQPPAEESPFVESELPETAASAKPDATEDPSETRPAPGDAAGAQTVAGEALAAEDASGEQERRRPLTHFTRLDADRDGFITEEDLRTLQSPARLDLRLRAILSAMDSDGDGRLSEAEFRAAMGEPTP